MHRTPRLRSGFMQGASGARSLALSPGLMNYAQIAFGGIGLGFLFYGFYAVSKVLKMRSWPSVPADVLDTNVRWEAFDGKVARRLHVSYRYTVRGAVFTSSRITVSDFLLATGEPQVRYLQRKLRSGVRAYYDPSNPQAAILVRPGASYPIMMFAMALGGLLIPVLAFYAKQAP